jgi:hypothetical protein
MAFRPFIVILFCFLVVLRLAGAGTPPDKMSGLLSNSPFGSAKSGVAGGTAGGEALEFRAFLGENGSKFFSIYETATKRSNWVELNDSVNGFSVKGYDAAKESITVEYQGKTMTLAIKRAPAVAQVMQQPPQPMPGPGPTGVMPSANNPSGQAGPTTVDQQRIQQIQEEIRRRRALRSQAATPGNVPGAPPNYGGPQPAPGTTGPMPQPSNSTGPVPMPQLVPQGSNPAGPQLLPPKT